MSEAPRQIQQNAGETRARGTATDAVEHFRALPRRAEEEQNRHQPALKVAVLPWRFCPTFLGVMRRRTKDAPDCAMRCRLALINNLHEFVRTARLRTFDVPGRLRVRVAVQISGGRGERGRP